MAGVDLLLQQAAQARAEDRPDDAQRDLVEEVRLCRKSGDAGTLAKALKALGQIERDLGHLDIALQHYQEAAAIYRSQTDPLNLAHTVRHVADIHRNLGQPELAEAYYDEALVLYRGDRRTLPLDLANTLRGLGILKSDAGEIEQAKLIWQEARALYMECNVEPGVAESSRRLALLSNACFR